MIKVGYSRQLAYAYTASGAGTTGVNGGYTQSGTYNSHSYYKNANGYFLFYSTTSGVDWAFAATLGGTTLYHCSTITGTWLKAGGASPVPTVVSG
jgi:hypothetical protein